MEPTPLPPTLDEVVAYVRALYEPNSPATIPQISDRLSKLQQSRDGWRMAQSLFNYPDADNKVKFYAALTIIIKLNRDSLDLHEDDAKWLLETLITRFVLSLGDGSAGFVVNKLCTALVTYFVQFSKLWPRPIRHLLYCLDLGHCTAPDALDVALPAPAVIGSLSPAKLTALICFASTLVEEVGKTAATSPFYIKVHERMKSSAQEVVVLLHRGLLIAEAQKSSLACYQAWILYAQRQTSDVATLIAPLQSIVELAMNCFQQDHVFEETAELLADIISFYPNFLNDAHYGTLADMFRSPWGRARHASLVRNPADSIGFGLLMIAYGDYKVDQLMQSTDEDSQGLLTMLGHFLGARGFPVIDNNIFVVALEFWSTFIERMTDKLHSAADGANLAWIGCANQHVEIVVQCCWQKMQWPCAQEMNGWDSAERQAFIDARKDVVDFFQALYALKGKMLVQWLADQIAQQLPVQAWTGLEASAFCLANMSDAFSELDSNDDQLEQVFSPLFFRLLVQSNKVPVRFRQTALLLIERYSSYFGRRTDHLSDALEILFGAVTDRSLGLASAKSIYQLCASNRSLLAPRVDQFIDAYQHPDMRTSPDLDDMAEQRLVWGIACIIQAIPGENARLQAFMRLYSLVKEEWERALALKSNPHLLNMALAAYLRGIASSDGKTALPHLYPDDVAYNLTLRALRCLASLAKGMQALVEVEAKSNLPDSGPEAVPISDRLAGVQADIMQLLGRVARVFPDRAEATELLCAILNTGFMDLWGDAAPFVWPPEGVTAFFVNQPPTNARIGYMIGTACSFVEALTRGPRLRAAENLGRLVPWVIGLMQAMPEPDSDVEIAQNGTDLVRRVMNKIPEALFNAQTGPPLEFFFTFSLQVLGGTQPLSKYAAALFWAEFLQMRAPDPTIKEMVSQVLDALGPMLAKILAEQVLGKAARSDLDKLCEPLKKLVVNQARAQQWLEAALVDETLVPSARVRSQDRVVFAKKILQLRGSRSTNQVVKEFWLACRGSKYAYA